MSEDHLSAPLNQSEVDTLASAMPQKWQDNVDRNTSVTRTFVHLRQEAARSRKGE